MAFLFTLAGARALASSQVAGPEESGFGEDPPHLSDRILNYRIEVGLDPFEKKVTGHEILTWRNQSGQALQDFCFHLYLNAFKNNRSTFVRESSSRPLWDGIEEIPDDYWGYTKVETIQVMSDEESFRPQFFRDGSGYLYSRYDSPTVAQAGRELAALEGTESAAMFASGMAAMSTAILTLAAPDRRIVTQSEVYGGTTELMNQVLPGWGFEVETLTRDELHDLEPARLQGAAVLCLETPTNPGLRLVDLAAVAKVARKAGVPTIVDSTFASPVVQRPAELGIDLVMHSATKYLGGHKRFPG